MFAGNLGRVYSKNCDRLSKIQHRLKVGLLSALGYGATMENTQPKTFRKSFKEAIRKYLNTTSPSEASRAKDEIIKTVNTTTDSDARKQIKEVLAEFEALPAWVESHLTVGSLYTDRGLVYGWWRDDQMQAESLPVKLSKTYRKGTFGKIEVLANRNGFGVAIPLPLLDGGSVFVPDFETNQYAAYGWANALPLQWHRTADGYTVDRSITTCGFWAAWKWWPGAADYYANNPPSPLVESFDFCDEAVTDF